MKASHPTLGNCSLRCPTSYIPVVVSRQGKRDNVSQTKRAPSALFLFGSSPSQGMSSTFLSSLTRTMRSFLLTPSINAVALAI